MDPIKIRNWLRYNPNIDYKPKIKVKLIKLLDEEQPVKEPNNSLSIFTTNKKSRSSINSDSVPRVEVPPREEPKIEKSSLTMSINDFSVPINYYLDNHKPVKYKFNISSDNTNGELIFYGELLVFYGGDWRTVTSITGYKNYEDVFNRLQACLIEHMKDFGETYPKIEYV